MSTATRTPAPMMTIDVAQAIQRTRRGGIFRLGGSVRRSGSVSNGRSLVLVMTSSFPRTVAPSTSDVTEVRSRTA